MVGSACPQRGEARLAEGARAKAGRCAARRRRARRLAERPAFRVEDDVGSRLAHPAQRVSPRADPPVPPRLRARPRPAIPRHRRRVRCRDPGALARRDEHQPRALFIARRPLRSHRAQHRSRAPAFRARTDRAGAPGTGLPARRPLRLARWNRRSGAGLQLPRSSLAQLPSRNLRRGALHRRLHDFGRLPSSRSARPPPLQDPSQSSRLHRGARVERRELESGPSGSASG